MAEKIVSPGVFTREKDLSFLPQGIGEIGAVVIGPTLKGPAFLPTVVESFADFEIKFGSVTEKTYVPYTVQSYLRSAGRVTIVRTLGLNGYKWNSITLKASDNKKVLAVLAPSAKSQTSTKLGLTATDGGDVKTSINQLDSSADFVLKLSGSDLAAVEYSASMDATSDIYIDKVFGTDPQATAKEVYVYKQWQSEIKTYKTSSLTLDVDNIDLDGTEYAAGETPIIQSQNLDSLFSFKTRAHGTDQNTEIKISIYDIKKAGSIAGSEYGQFSVAVRKFNDKDKQPEILETFQACNLDPNSGGYVLKKIGDRYTTIDADGKITYKGDWPNKSEYIFINPDSNLEYLPRDTVPFGHAAYKEPVSSSAGYWVPAPTMKTEQTLDGVYSNKVHYGINLDDVKNYNDNYQFFAPIPGGTNQIGMADIDATAEGSASRTGSVSLNDVYGSDGGPDGYITSSDLLTLTGANVNQLKFTVGFQSGFDGFDPSRAQYTGKNISGNNLYGYDFGDSTKEGQIAWKKALNTIANPDEFDVNMILTPGIVQGYHDAIVTHTTNICEARGDCFYIVDCSIPEENITTATGYVSTLDTNYVATYYPWVKIVDTGKAKPVWVPPSVVLSGVIAYTDQVTHEWFAPAGLNRGGLTEVIEAETRLTHEERDDLYENRVNPIASFPGQGVVVWGQKTLQGKPSALDRVNVRRLLIRVKKFIASASRYLVFEQNTSATRARFLNIANPFLESVQANSGLSAFKVVMDDSNNTPDLVDRNILYGQIFLQPTRTAEFIVLDFSILPTGAAFPE